MFEFSVAFKYLLPQRKHLSLSIISLISVLVISLVVWLVLVFLSVTDGLEKNWIEKLVSLNGPLHLTPTEDYYQSYYYLIDGHSQRSNYQSKSLSEKLYSPYTDPYDPEQDPQIPLHWPPALRNDKGELKDLVKELNNLIHNLRPHSSFLSVSPFESALATYHIRMQRKELGPQGFLSSSSTMLSQSGLVQSLPPKPSFLHKNLLSPSPEDIHNLLHSKDFLSSNGSSIQSYLLEEILSIHEVKVPQQGWSLPLESLKANSFPANHRFQVLYQHIPYPQVFLPTSKQEAQHLKSLWQKKELLFTEGTLVMTSPPNFIPNEEPQNALAITGPILLPPETLLKASIDKGSLSKAKQLDEALFNLSFNLQGLPIQIKAPITELTVAASSAKQHFSHSPSSLPLWPYTLESETELYLPDGLQGEEGVLLPKSFKDKGALIGDRGHVSFQSATPGSMQEQKLPLYVAGFFDPGLAPMGSRSILSPLSLPHRINNLTGLENEERLQGLRVDIKPLEKVKSFKQLLLEQLKEKNLDRFWKVESFYDYEFSKDFIQQLQSDKTLLTLIAVIINIVACSNIVSMLILLVNDKKTEIAILQSMGASRRSIAFIFGFCGLSLGVLGCVLGTFLASITLSHFDLLVNLLSFIQGHNAFNVAFYGDSLPTELSTEALGFVILTTTLLSLVAGLIPAVKASSLKPTLILKS